MADTQPQETEDDVEDDIAENDDDKRVLNQDEIDSLLGFDSDGGDGEGGGEVVDGEGGHLQTQARGR